jgi:imidazolonepropionase-like amidohydrolase
MRIRTTLLLTCLICLAGKPGLRGQTPLNSSVGSVIILRAGRLIDPETGTVSANQSILVKDGRILEIGNNVAAPAGAEVVDLSRYSVLPGLVDAHTHLAMTIIRDLQGGYFTYVQESTALRAIQAASNGIQMLASGFTIVRDMGNAGLYADTALRVAIEQGWLPGPTVINAGIIIGPMGGQFSPTPEMALEHKIVEPEYLDADTPDEIVKAVRRNILFGAKVIKVCADCKSYGYSTEDLKLFVKEAGAAGLKVSAHIQTEEGARRAIEAGLWSIEHDYALTDEIHRLMARKGIWRVGTEEPFTPITNSQAGVERTIAGIKNAYANKVKMAFATDISSPALPGMTRGQRAIDYIQVWKAAGIPAKEILKIMTMNGYRVLDIANQRGPLKPGLPADIIAVPGNPLEDIDALRKVDFVMKDGVVFKRDGVMVPEKFFHSGPVNGWRIR